MIFIDGSTNNECNGVEVVLISPQGEETKLVVRLQFWASNNEVEYETLLIGLRVMRNVGVAWVLVHLVSHLLVHQVKCAFEVKDEKLQKYCEAMERSKNHFMDMRLK